MIFGKTYLSPIHWGSDGAVDVFLFSTNIEKGDSSILYQHIPLLIQLNLILCMCGYEKKLHKPHKTPLWFYAVWPRTAIQTAENLITFKIKPNKTAWVI